MTTTHNYFTDSTGGFFSGIWESTPGKWSCDYSKSEFVYLISGRARLTDADGHGETFGPGSAFVIPAGFKGSWETLESLKKYYAIFQPGLATCALHEQRDLGRRSALAGAQTATA